MKRILVLAVAGMLFLGWSAGEAWAYRRHYHGHHRSSVVFSFGFGAPLYYGPHYYYRPYYYHPAYYHPYYYEPAPVYVAPAPVYYPSPGFNEFFGTVLGAIGGGVIGAQIGSGSGRAAATVGGVLLGSLIGNRIGFGLDDYDRRLAFRNTQYALESMRSGTVVEWRGPSSGAYGTVSPRPAFQNQAGQYCREFQETVIVGGQEQAAYGTACRQPDGQWRIVQ